MFCIEIRALSSRLTRSGWLHTNSLSIKAGLYTCNFCCHFLLDILRTFTTHLLIHIHHEKNVAVEIPAKIASVNGPLVFTFTVIS